MIATKLVAPRFTERESRTGSADFSWREPADGPQLPSCEVSHSSSKSASSCRGRLKFQTVKAHLGVRVIEDGIQLRVQSIRVNVKIAHRLTIFTPVDVVAVLLHQFDRLCQVLRDRNQMRPGVLNGHPLVLARQRLQGLELRQGLTHLVKVILEGFQLYVWLCQYKRCVA